MADDPRIAESAVTPEAHYLGRRELLKKLGLGLAMGTLGPIGCDKQAPQRIPTASSGTNFPHRFKQNSTYSVSEKINTYEQATTYNNFYEFTTDKYQVKTLAKNFKTHPWSIQVTGEVKKPLQLDYDRLLKLFPIEQRIYRFRCVETWAMVVPWLGFELRNLIKYIAPLSSAKYISFQTLQDPKQMPGLSKPVIKWPYREALTMEEAMHPLTLLSVGLYDKLLPPQNGAPIRLVVPWKYGFKSIKSINKISFHKQRPSTSWNIIAPNEYGFYANVNPAVDHPRWSQAKERKLGELFKRETLPFNGYAKSVAGLYKNLDLKKNY